MSQDQASSLVEDEPKKSSCCGAKDDAKTKTADEGNWILTVPRGLCSCLPFTDLLMSILFIAFLIGMIVVFGVACQNGDLVRLQYGTDFSGTACGDSTAGTGDFKHQYWSNPLYYSSLGSICLDSCPGAQKNGSNTDASMSSTEVYCVCNNNLTIGRYTYSITDPSTYAESTTGAANSLAEGATGYLAKDCASTKCENAACQTKGPNWVKYDTANNTIATDDIPSGIYYYLPQTWMTAYPPAGQLPPAVDPALSLKWMVPQCNYAYTTYQMMNRCVPQVDSYFGFVVHNTTLTSSPTSSAFGDFANSFAHVGGQAFSDLETTFWVIIGSFGIALVLGFLWIYFMKICAACVVWCVILCAIVMSALLAVALFWAGLVLQKRCDETPQLATYDTDKQNMYICYVLGGIFAFIFLLITCAAMCYCKQIREATELISLASEAMMDFPYLIFYPVFQIAGLFLLVFAWASGAALLASSGDQVSNPIYGTSSWNFNDSLKYMMWYWLFGFLWITELMMACGFMIVSCCFAIWFFSEEKEVKIEGRSLSCCGGAPEPQRIVPSWVLSKAMRITYFNHLGTAAFGALIIAIIDLLRIIVEYVDHKKKQMDEATGGDPIGCSKLWEYIICCFRSCLYCLDKCMRYLNKQAYIQTIINGTSLCTSACNAISVMFRQAALFLIMGGIQSGVFWFGKLAICMATAAICGSIINAAYADAVSSIVLPTFVCLLIGFGVATAFIQVYDMGIDTMLMCYAEAKSGGKHSDQMHIPHELDDSKEGSYAHRSNKKMEDQNEEKEKQKASRAQQPPNSAVLEGEAVKV